MAFQFKMSKFKPKGLPLSRKTKDMASVCISMVLVILASQSNAFDFLLDTSLGRMALIGAVLLVCFMNYIFGVACILFLVIAVAINYNRREGMETEVDDTNDECQRYLLECEDCKQQKDGNFCEKHAALCSAGISSEMNEPEGFQNNSLNDVERQLQFGEATHTKPVKPKENMNHVVGFDGNANTVSPF